MNNRKMMVSMSMLSTMHMESQAQAEVMLPRVIVGRIAMYVGKRGLNAGEQQRTTECNCPGSQHWQILPNQRMLGQ
jgi:hypothetical protein